MPPHPLFFSLSPTASIQSQLLAEQACRVVCFLLCLFDSFCTGELVVYLKSVGPALFGAHCLFLNIPSLKAKPGITTALSIVGKLYSIHAVHQWSTWIKLGSWHTFPAHLQNSSEDSSVPAEDRTDHRTPSTQTNVYSDESTWLHNNATSDATMSRVQENMKKLDAPTKRPRFALTSHVNEWFDYHSSMRKTHSQQTQMQKDGRTRTWSKPWQPPAIAAKSIPVHCDRYCCHSPC